MQITRGCGAGVVCARGVDRGGVRARGIQRGGVRARGVERRARRIQRCAGMRGRDCCFDLQPFHGRRSLIAIGVNVRICRRSAGCGNGVVGILSTFRPLGSAVAPGTREAQATDRPPDVIVPEGGCSPESRSIIMGGATQSA